jgi:hypothetical protein
MEPYQNGEDAAQGDDLLQYLPADLFMDLTDTDLLESSTDDEEKLVYDKTEEQENVHADLMEQAVPRLYGRNQTDRHK